MIIETMLLALVIGKLRGGRLGNLNNLYIKGWYLIVLAFLIETIALLMAIRGQASLSLFIESNFYYIHITIYSLLMLGLLMNIGHTSFKFISLGSLLNFIPLLLNRGKMPVYIKSLKLSNQYSKLALLDEGRIMTHSLTESIKGYRILGDIIPIGRPYPLPKIISIGDIVIALGIFILIQSHIKEKTTSKEMKDFYKP